MNKPRDIIVQSAAIICPDNRDGASSILPSFLPSVVVVVALHQLLLIPFPRLRPPHPASPWLLSLVITSDSRNRGIDFRCGLQAEEQQHRRHCEAVQDEEDKKAEIYNHVTGDFLTEAREQAESVHGPHKPLVSRYKGMTADELKVFRDGQLGQMENIRVRRRKSLFSPFGSLSRGLWILKITANFILFFNASY